MYLFFNSIPAPEKKSIPRPMAIAIKEEQIIKKINNF